MKKLYIGNLSFNTTEPELHDAFKKYGPVASVKIITDKFSGESRGFGFVEIESDENADLAIREMDGFSLGGSSLKVNEARPMDRDRGGRGGFGDSRPRQGGGGGGYRSDRGGRPPRRNSY